MEEKQIEMKRAHRLTMEGRRCAAITGEKWCSRPRTAF